MNQEEREKRVLRVTCPGTNFTAFALGPDPACYPFGQRQADDYAHQGGLSTALRYREKTGPKVAATGVAAVVTQALIDNGADPSEELYVYEHGFQSTPDKLATALKRKVDEGLGLSIDAIAMKTVERILQSLQESPDVEIIEIEAFSRGCFVGIQVAEELQRRGITKKVVMNLREPVEGDLMTIAAINEKQAIREKSLPENVVACNVFYMADDRNMGFNPTRITGNTKMQPKRWTMSGFHESAEGSSGHHLSKSTNPGDELNHCQAANANVGFINATSDLTTYEHLPGFEPSDSDYRELVETQRSSAALMDTYRQRGFYKHLETAVFPVFANLQSIGLTLQAYRLGMWRGRAHMPEISQFKSVCEQLYPNEYALDMIASTSDVAYPTQVMTSKLIRSKAELGGAQGLDSAINGLHQFFVSGQKTDKGMVKDDPKDLLVETLAAGLHRVSKTDCAEMRTGVFAQKGTFDLPHKQAVVVSMFRTDISAVDVIKFLGKKSRPAKIGRSEPELIEHITITSNTRANHSFQRIVAMAMITGERDCHTANIMYAYNKKTGEEGFFKIDNGWAFADIHGWRDPFAFTAETDDLAETLSKGVIRVVDNAKDMSKRKPTNHYDDYATVGGGIFYKSPNFIAQSEDVVSRLKGGASRQEIERNINLAIQSKQQAGETDEVICEYLMTYAKEHLQLSSAEMRELDSRKTNLMQLKQTLIDIKSKAMDARIENMSAFNRRMRAQCLDLKAEDIVKYEPLDKNTLNNLKKRVEYALPELDEALRRKLLNADNLGEFRAIADEIALDNKDNAKLQVLREAADQYHKLQIALESNEYIASQRAALLRYNDAVITQSAVVEAVDTAVNDYAATIIKLSELAMQERGYAADKIAISSSREQLVALRAEIYERFLALPDSPETIQKRENAKKAVPNKAIAGKLAEQIQPDDDTPEKLKFKELMALCDQALTLTSNMTARSEHLEMIYQSKRRYQGLNVETLKADIIQGASLDEKHVLLLQEQRDLASLYHVLCDIVNHSRTHQLTETSIDKLNSYIALIEPILKQEKQVIPEKRLHAPRNQILKAQIEKVIESIHLVPEEDETMLLPELSMLASVSNDIQQAFESDSHLVDQQLNLLIETFGDKIVQLDTTLSNASNAQTTAAYHQIKQFYQLAIKTTEEAKQIHVKLNKDRSKRAMEMLLGDEKAEHDYSAENIKRLIANWNNKKGGTDQVINDGLTVQILDVFSKAGGNLSAEKIAIIKGLYEKLQAPESNKLLGISTAVRKITPRASSSRHAMMPVAVDKAKDEKEQHKYRNEMRVEISQSNKKSLSQTEKDTLIDIACEYDKFGSNLDSTFRYNILFDRTISLLRSDNPYNTEKIQSILQFYQLINAWNSEHKGDQQNMIDRNMRVQIMDILYAHIDAPNYQPSKDAPQCDALVSALESRQCGLNALKDIIDNGGGLPQSNTAETGLKRR